MIALNHEDSLFSGVNTTSEVSSPTGITSIIFDQKDKTYSFTAKNMQKAMEQAGFTVILEDIKSILEVKVTNRIILTTRGTDETNKLMREFGLSALPPSEPQGYSIRKRHRGSFTDWYIIGFDKNGAMYGGLDLGQTVQLKGFDALVDCDKTPYIKNRGIKFNIPLDARTPSYSDSGDSAQKNILNMWDINFWHEFMDEMAKDYYNVLSLWSLHPFPSMVKVPEYPNVALEDVKKTNTLLQADLEGRGMSTSESLENLITIKSMTIDEKIKFWQDIMEYAKDRGIDIYIITWNIFIYGTETSDYGFTTSVTDKKTQDYFRKSVSALINTYPLLKGIGITAGENMSRNAAADEAWLYNTYGEGINDALVEDPSRSFSLIHRIQYANISVALNTFSQINARCTVTCSFKYSQAHMYSSTKPDYIHAEDDQYLKSIGDIKTWLSVRDDDYYMFRCGDPEFVRAYIKNMPYSKLQGFYMGPDGYNWGREYISKDSDCSNELVIKKRWYSFMLWGRLSFDPYILTEDFVNIIGAYFTEADSQKLYDAWSKSSQIIPAVNRFHNGGCQLDFQWYPEACTSKTGFHDINSFINTSPQSGEGLIDIHAYSEAILNNAFLTGITPIELASNLEILSKEALTFIEGMINLRNKELQKTIEDIRAMSYLGLYYSLKILGATYKCIADKCTDKEKKLEYTSGSVAYLKEASHYWKSYAAKVSTLYNSQTLTRLIPDNGAIRDVDITRLQKDVDNDILLAGGL